MIIRDLLLPMFGEYFPAGFSRYFIDLPIPSSINKPDLKTTLVRLPGWAADIGIGPTNSLLVPSCCICGAIGPTWEDVDWWRAAFELMTCEAEYSHELGNGPIHSYSYKLPASMAMRWERAWVNRIFIFLRRWVSHENNSAESDLLGDRPRGVVHLTHDVDYVNKTLALRLKQSAFINYNLLKSLSSGNFSGAAEMLARLFRFGLGQADYWQFPVIEKLESEYSMSSSWNLYGGVGGFKRSSTELLLDPAYKVADQRITNQLKELQQAGNRIGLHQGFYSWQDSYRMKKEKLRLEQALGQSVESCRQHWLRFSFKDTWKAQEDAGFLLDTTLGFNDRPGFRNSAALRMPAWISGENRFSITLEILPMILMDSHLFDYGQFKADTRRKLIDYYLDEIAFVGGEATVIWHQRVFHSDYGWGDEYRYLLEGIKSRNIKT